MSYVSGGAETKLDLILMKPGSDITPIDCRAISGECCVTPHRPIRADFRVNHMKRKKVGGRRKLRNWKLKEEHVRQDFISKLVDKFQEIGNSWQETQAAILDACGDKCGETNGNRGREKETWWLCDEVQDAIRLKKEAYKVWHGCRTTEDKSIYRARKRDAERSVVIAKQRALDEWCENLNTAEGRRKMFAMAKQLRRDKKDIIGGYFVKVENGEIKTTDADIRQRWKDYLSELFNVENPSEMEDLETVEGPLQAGLGGKNIWNLFSPFLPG